MPVPMALVAFVTPGLEEPTITDIPEDALRIASTEGWIVLARDSDIPYRFNPPRLVDDGFDHLDGVSDIDDGA